MKNKKWWILPAALLAVFGLLMTGCPTDGGGGGGKKDGGLPSDATDNLFNDGWKAGPSVEGPKTLKLGDNFRYGAGYQGTIDWADLINVNIEKNEVYEMEIEFTVSRDLEDSIEWVLVDTSEAANWWTALTRYKKLIEGVDKADETDTPQEADPPDGDFTPTPAADAVIFKQATAKNSYTGRLLTKTPASRNDAVLAFTTKGEGKKGEAGTGKKGDVTLTFSKFVVTKYTWGEADPGENIPVWPGDYEDSGVSVVVGPNETYGNNFIIGDEWKKLEDAAELSYLVVKVDVTNGTNKTNAGYGYGRIAGDETAGLNFKYGDVETTDSSSDDYMISTNRFLISEIIELNEWPNAQVNLWDGLKGDEDVISMKIWSPKK